MHHYHHNDYDWLVERRQCKVCQPSGNNDTIRRVSREHHDLCRIRSKMVSYNALARRVLKISKILLRFEANDDDDDIFASTERVQILNGKFRISVAIQMAEHPAYFDFAIRWET